MTDFRDHKQFFQGDLYMFITSPRDYFKYLRVFGKEWRQWDKQTKMNKNMNKQQTKVWRKEGRNKWRNEETKIWTKEQKTKWVNEQLKKERKKRMEWQCNSVSFSFPARSKHSIIISFMKEFLGSFVLEEVIPDRRHGGENWDEWPTVSGLQISHMLVLARWHYDDDVICEWYLCAQTWVNMISDITEKQGYA